MVAWHLVKIMIIFVIVIVIKDSCIELSKCQHVQAFLVSKVRDSCRLSQFFVQARDMSWLAWL